MTVMMKEEKRMDRTTKTYLEVYEEFINGYKEYKMEKQAAIKTDKTRNALK
ncbi:hypothetical protein ACRC6Q_08665 [Planococcus sp. SE5232]|uniref:hypothetical protein n=1 Tax=unclassified Planococcus (in: firmicutes) TaxID=2662419 RepID=UPI001CC12263|nr:hypothetical protein [Planococcus sp. 4-30]